MFDVQTHDFGGGVQTIITITIITTTCVLVEEALGKINFPTMLSGVLRGRRKGVPNTSVVGTTLTICYLKSYLPKSYLESNS